MSDREELFEILERASVNAATALTAKDKEIEALRERVGLLKGCYDQAVECSLEWKARAETVERRVKDVSKSRDFYVGLCQELRSLAETAERERVAEWNLRREAEGSRDAAKASADTARAALNTIDEIVHTPTAGNEKATRHFQRDFDAIRKIAVPFRAARAVIEQGE